MKWYYRSNGIHVDVRVFMNGGYCGKLCFRLDEFNEIMNRSGNLINYINEAQKDLPSP